MLRRFQNVNKIASTNRPYLVTGTVYALELSSLPLGHQHTVNDIT